MPDAAHTHGARDLKLASPRLRAPTSVMKPLLWGGCLERQCWFMPDDELIVGWHGVICQKVQTLLTRKRVDILEISDAARGIARLQIAIELRVARARVAAAVTKRSVNTDDSGRGRYGANSAEQVLYRAPSHDVQRVGAEDRIDRLRLPRQSAHVELDGGAQIWRSLVSDPFAQPSQVSARVTGLPGEVWKVSREMRGMLAGAAADFQDLATVREGARKDLEYRSLVTLAGFGDGVAHARESVTFFRFANLNGPLSIGVL